MYKTIVYQTSSGYFISDQEIKTKQIWLQLYIGAGLAQTTSPITSPSYK